MIKKAQKKRLYRSNERRIAGVCGGIAEYFNIDPVLIRLLWLFFTLMGGSGILIYIIAWIVIPPRPDYKKHSNYNDSYSS